MSDYIPPAAVGSYSGGIAGEDLTEPDTYPAIWTDPSGDRYSAGAEALSGFKKFLRVIGDSQNAELTATLNAAVSMITTSTGVLIEPTAIKARWTHPNRIVRVPLNPLDERNLTLTTIEHDGTETELADNEYAAKVGEGRDIEIMIKTGTLPAFYYGSRSLRLDAAGGYQAANLPDELELAVWQAARSIYESRGESGGMLPQSAKAILRSYQPRGSYL